jgi:hypothetical protein
MLKPPVQLIGDARRVLMKAMQLRLAAAADLAVGPGDKGLVEWGRAEKEALKCSEEADDWAREALGFSAYNQSFEMNRGKVDLMLKILQLKAEHATILDSEFVADDGGKGSVKRQLDILDKVQFIQARYLHISDSCP